MDISKIRTIYEYEFRRGVTAAQTVRRVCEVFGKDATTEKTVRRWFKKFRDGNFDLSNKPREKPRSKVDHDQLRAAVEADPSQSTCVLAATFGVSMTTILKHIKEIRKKNKLDKWVPYELTDKKK